MVASGGEVVTFKPNEPLEVDVEAGPGLAGGGCDDELMARLAAAEAASFSTLLLRRSDLAGRLGDTPVELALEVPAAARLRLSKDEHSHSASVNPTGQLRASQRRMQMRVVHFGQFDQTAMD